MGRALRAHHDLIGEPPNTPKSLRGVAERERRSFPFRISEFFQIGRVEYSGDVSEGDVNCHWAAFLRQDGAWLVTADFEGTGVIVGDYYLVEFIVDQAHRVGAPLDGQLGTHLSGPDRRHSQSKDGLDPWIRDNWTQVSRNPISVTLQVSPDISGLAWGIAVALAVGAYAIFGGQNESIQVGPCDDNDPRSKPCTKFTQTGG
jgi:hypothetical protein